MRLLLILSLLAVLLLQGPHAIAAESLALAFVPARDKLFDTNGSPPNIVPADGKVIVVGRYDAGGFEIESSSNIEVLSPDGTQIPLTIEKGSIFVEFGVIVSVKFCFSVPLASLQKMTDVYMMRWGKDVSSPNTEIDTIVLDSGIRDGYREFRIAQAASGDASVATIEVIAESGADYYFLWYLLPMALLFAILTIRKIRARDSNSETAA